jgi:SAM-dependent methyltransferase
MNTVKEHYDQQLADVYSWMAGGFETVTERNRAFLRQLEIDKIACGLAIDLGAGSGFQSVPLAEFGFSVVAVDFSSTLLTELRERAGNLSIRTVQDDILNFSKHIDQAAQVIVCMGDTLTHLESLDAVKALLTDAARALGKGGMLVLTFRDYVSAELRNEQSFIPVQSDEFKILTCFLEYHKDFVEVFDLLYRKEVEQWTLKVSSYPKLRINRGWVENQLLENGLVVVHNELANGMIKIVTNKPE